MNNLILKAEEAYLQGRSQEAIGLLAKVISEDSDNIRALSNIGIIFHAVGQYQDAKIAFEKVLSLDPSNLDMRKNLVLSLLTMKEYKEAKKHLELLLAANQNEFQLWTLMGRVESSLDNDSAAIADLERSLLLNPEQPEIKEYLETLKAKTNKTSEKIQELSHRTKNLFIFSSPERVSETDCLSEGLSKAFKLERIASVKSDPYRKAIPYADIIWLDGLNEITLSCLNNKDLLQDKQIFLRLSRDDMQKNELKLVSYIQAQHICFETFFYRDTFQSYQLNLNPGTKLHVIRKCIDDKIYTYSDHSGRDNICSVISPSSSPGEIILTLEAFVTLLKENREASLHLYIGKRDVSKDRYMLHYLSINGLEKKVFYTTENEDIKTFLSKNDYFLTTEVQPGVLGLLESLAMGLKPLIRFTLAQNEYTPENTLWKNFTELVQIYNSPPDPEITSQIIRENQGPQKLVDFYINALSSGKKSV